MSNQMKDSNKILINLSILLKDMFDYLQQYDIEERLELNNESPHQKPRLKRILKDKVPVFTCLKELGYDSPIKDVIGLQLRYLYSYLEATPSEKDNQFNPHYIAEHLRSLLKN